jgi:hypothetical protein
MLTIQILTKNNAKTILKTLESIETLEANVIVGDLGSTDITIDLCETSGVSVEKLGDIGRNEARNRLTRKGWNMALEPWEVIVQGHQRVHQQQGCCSYVSILNQKILTKELRFWTPRMRFLNTTFESLAAETERESGVILYSSNQRDPKEDLRLIERWKQKLPLAPQPYYYQACVELSQGKYDQFLQTANHFLFMGSSASMSTTMTRYYMAYVYLTHKKKARPALQNLNLCLCARPLMAEFWCLLGDVYYHLLHQFEDSKRFYENAMILGGRRLKTDKWPMDLTKYKEYPKKMIASCQGLIKGSSFYYDMA